MWFVPTYNRPEQLFSVLKQINKVGCSTKGMVFVNEGLIELAGEPCPKPEYTDIDKLLPENWTIHYNRENIGCDAAMNWCFEHYPHEEFYGLICDDEYVYTPEWDKILIEAAGRWNIAHGNDGWQSFNRIHSYVTVGGELVRACGWWSLPGLWHWYHDDVQEVLASTLILKRHCQNVKTEHKHYLAGKAPFDPTYKSGESKNLKDKEVFMAWVENEAPALVEKIAGLINKERI